ncbi:MAG: ribosome small subunit-dependent GTPase A, partial [Niameybacter sp.]
MMQGTIIKGIAGFYYVRVKDEVFECRARGKFRNEGLTPLIGDAVGIEVDEDNQDNHYAYRQGHVVDILPR